MRKSNHCLQNLWMDSGRVRQIVTNGVTNAIKAVKATDGEGRIAIRVWFVPAQVRSCYC